MVMIRDAGEADLPAITAIYNEAIATTVATFDTQEKTVEDQRRWLRSHGPQNPVVVAEDEGTVVGWASLSQWSDRCAYSLTAEVSVYVLTASQGKGIGRRLMEAVLAKGKQAGLRTVLARITEGNAISLHLHRSLGFTDVGTMRQVGEKFGRTLDVHLLQKLF